MKSVGRDEDMPKKVHVLLWLSLLIIFIHLAVVVEEDGEDAMLHFYLIGQTRIKPVEHSEHLVGVVEQPAWIGMMHGSGCRIEAERLIEAIGKLLDDSRQGFVRAITEQMLDSAVPDIPANRSRQKIV